MARGGGGGSKGVVSDTHADMSKINNTAWPAACPSKYEENILSICCGNSHYHWAVHKDNTTGYIPSLFWRTPVLRSDEIDRNEPCDELARFLPKGCQKIIFGAEDGPIDKNQATKAAAEKRIPALSVYVISTNDDHEKGIEFLFRDIPCRLYKFQPNDFFSEQQGAYKGIGVDRLAAVKAAAGFSSFPVLVIDGGTAMTYTGADREGNIMGGGIVPGLALKFRSLIDYTGALPKIEHDELVKFIEENSSKKSPASIFSGTTKEAVMVGALTEMAGLCRNMVNSFLAELAKKDKEKSPEDKMDEDKKENGDEKKPNGFVCVTGGDGDIIHKLLQADHSHIVATEPGTKIPVEGPDTFYLKKHKHLIHYGISKVLSEKVEVVPDSEENKLRSEIVGQRVAKEFDISQAGGDKIYRGTIVTVAPGDKLENDWFYVRYDDGDTEHMSITELYDGLVLFNKKGEKVGEKFVASSEGNKKKEEAAKKSADTLKDASTIVQDHIKKVEEERKNAPEKPAPTTGTKRPRKDSGTPSAEKRRKSNTPSKKFDPHSFLKCRVAKFFDTDLYFGTVTKYIKASVAGELDLWHVLYDDDDQEDYDKKDLKLSITLYKEKQHLDPKRKSAVTDVAGDNEPEPMDEDKPEESKPGEEKPAEEKPAEKPTEEEATKPAEKPVEKPADKPAEEKAGEKPAEKAAEKPAEKAAEKPAEKAAEKEAEEPAEKPAEKPAENPAEKPAEKTPIDANPTEKKPDEAAKTTEAAAPAASAPAAAAAPAPAAAAAAPAPAAAAAPAPAAAAPAPAAAAPAPAAAAPAPAIAASAPTAAAPAPSPAAEAPAQAK